MAPPAAQATKVRAGRPSRWATSPGVRKIPVPTMMPTTMASPSQKPSDRLSSGMSPNGRVEIRVTPDSGLRRVPTLKSGLGHRYAEAKQAQASAWESTMSATSAATTATAPSSTPRHRAHGAAPAPAPAPAPKARPGERRRCTERVLREEVHVAPTVAARPRLATVRPPLTPRRGSIRGRPALRRPVGGSRVRAPGRAPLRRPVRGPHVPRCLDDRRARHHCRG